MKDGRIVSNSRQSRLSSRGFTLIELLVVVAIIALLVAILLPSLAKAKKYTRKVVCLSNANQIGKATITYANDNDDQMPPIWGAYPYATLMLSYDFSYKVGHVILLPYLGATEQDIEDGTGGGWKIWECPSATPARDEPVSQRTWSLAGQYLTKNLDYMQYCSAEAWPGSSTVYRRTKPGAPLFCDSVLLRVNALPAYSYLWANHDMAAGGEFVGVNTCRVDGSADWVACEDPRTPLTEFYRPPVSNTEHAYLFPKILGY